MAKNPKTKPGRRYAVQGKQLNDEVRERVMKAVQAAEVTQDGAAERFGWHKSEFTRKIANGETPIRLEELPGLAIAFGFPWPWPVLSLPKARLVATFGDRASELLDCESEIRALLDRKKRG